MPPVVRHWSVSRASSGAVVMSLSGRSAHPGKLRRCSDLVRNRRVNRSSLDIVARTVRDPNVWTGGVLQEKSESWVFGLAPMYPAFGWSSWAPGHHGYKRAFDLISG
jgi:hypothetical protein